MSHNGMASIKLIRIVFTARYGLNLLRITQFKMFGPRDGSGS